VYAIDVAMTTGDGKPREIGARTTVYKRMVDKKYGLKVWILDFIIHLNVQML
jgi:hypothetical protein